jgi:hypothetical protein
MNMLSDTYNIQTGERTDGRMDGRTERTVVNVPKMKTYNEWGNKINSFLWNAAVLFDRTFASSVHWAQSICVFTGIAVEV